MKNRYFIFSVLFWLVASVSMAVTLPSSSYSVYEGSEIGNEEYTLGIGTKFMNTSMLTTYEPGTCQTDKQDPDAIQNCEICCQDKIFGAGGSYSEQDYLACINDCMGASLPLGTPLMLLPFIGIYAVIRRNRKDKE